MNREEIKERIVSILSAIIITGALAPAALIVYILITESQSSQPLTHTVDHSLTLDKEPQ